MATMPATRSCERSAEQWRALQREWLPGYDPYATAAEGDWFDAETANGAVSFFHHLLCFIEGDRAGQPFELEDWQQAVVGCLLGWKQADGTRRYRESMLYLPRKNGKTPLCAGLALYGMFLDDEEGAQIYSAAAEREQAALIYRWASEMIHRQPPLNEKVRIYRTFKSIEYPAKTIYYKALSADASTKHGLNVHLAIIDELHAHPSRELVDTIRTGTASRRQPLVVYITTADYDRESICNDTYKYAGNIRDGVFHNHEFLPIIFEAEPDDDWTDPDVWRKANPNLGVSVREEYLRTECQRAQDDPTLENTFKRLHLNIRTQQDVRWLPLDQWDGCDDIVSEQDLEGQLCFGGLDLASREDIAGYVLVFPPAGDRDKYVLLPRLFLPEETARERDRKSGVPYLTWARQRHITLTSGSRCDYSAIQSSILADGKRFDVRDIGADRWNLHHMAQQLGEVGCEVVEFGQGFRDMSEPMKELGSLVRNRMIIHNGHPVMRWSAGNVAVKMDEANNIKPDKKKSMEKIDPIVMSIMGLGRAMVNSGPPQVSVYETRGIRTL